VCPFPFLVYGIICVGELSKQEDAQYHEKDEKEHAAADPAIDDQLPVAHKDFLICRLI
jgi:hypothetical protein